MTQSWALQTHLEGTAITVQARSGDEVPEGVLRSIRSILSNSSLAPIKLLRSRLKPGVDVRLEVPFSIPSPSLQWLKNHTNPTGKAHSLEELLCIAANQTQLPLYDYQRAGSDFLQKHHRALLADEMGLGKTLQAIAAIVDLIKQGEVSRVLVVVPKSLCLNWLAQFQKWAPHVAASLVLPTGAAARSVWPQRVGSSWVIVTTYEQVRRFPELIDQHADLVVADEAHRLRNSSSGTSQSFRKIARQRMWLLSGTPMERDPEDIAHLLSLLEPNRFSSRDARLPIAVLRERARPLVLRRSVEDVLSQLPAQVDCHEVLSLTPSQRKSYLICRKARTKVAIQRFSALRSICDLDPESGSSSKIDRSLQLVSQIRSSGESVVIFSYWRAPLAELKARLESDDHRPVVLTGDQSAYQRQEAVDRFENEGGILLASGHIAGEGLTLVRANHAIFLNRWWNPSRNSQAAGRIRRIGQVRTTFVYTFTCAGTVEELVDLLLERKAATNHDLVELLATPLGNNYI